MERRSIRKEEVQATKQYLYWQALKPYDIGAIEAGVWACIRELARFPKPSKIIQRMYSAGVEPDNTPERKALPEPMDPVIARESMQITYALLDGSMTLAEAVARCEVLDREYPNSIWGNMAESRRRTAEEQGERRMTLARQPRFEPPRSPRTLAEQKNILREMFPPT